MDYTRVLKKRRIDLHLSVYDVAIQTGLDKDGLSALERHDLDYFGDDLNEARGLIQQYCLAIGVNWEAIADQVDEDLMNYYQYTSTQSYASQIKKNYPPRVKKAVRQKKRPFFSWLTSRQALAGFVISGLAVLLLINYLLEQAAENRAQQLVLEHQQQLSEKEQETQRLAQQLKALKEQSALRPDFLLTQDGADEFTLYQAVAPQGKLLIEFELETPATISIYSEQKTLYLMRNTTTASYDLDVSKPLNISIELEPYTYGDQIRIGNERLDLDGLENGPQVILVTISDQPAPQEEPVWQEEELYTEDFYLDDEWDDSWSEDWDDEDWIEPEEEDYEFTE